MGKFVIKMKRDNLGKMASKALSKAFSNEVQFEDVELTLTMAEMPNNSQLKTLTKLLKTIVNDVDQVKCEWHKG